MPEAQVTLIERDARLGGKLLTDHVDGFVIEGAPDSFLSSKPAGMRLASELGISHRLQGVRAETRRTFVMHDGALVQLPEGLSGLVPTKLGPLFRSPLLSRRGKLRAALEPLVPRRATARDESLGSFIRRRMGREPYERLIEPLMAGIYGGNGDDLSLEATFPRLRALEREHGSLLRGLRSTSPPSPPSDRPASPFLSPIGGMREIVDVLEARLDRVRILRCTEAVAIERQGGGYSVALQPVPDRSNRSRGGGPLGGDPPGPAAQTNAVGGGTAVPAQAVILAAPAYTAASLLEGIDGHLARLLSSIPYASTATVSLGYTASSLPRPLDGHGYIIPRREGRPILACTWSSSKFAHRAPEGHILLRGFIGRAGREEVLGGTDDELVELFRAELHATLGISAEPLLARVYRWPRAMPQYRVGHLDVLLGITRSLDHLPGVYLAGAGYRGVGIPDCIQSGETAADRALAQLTTARL
jgi:oxygen-dependent protoporphyrinogen oxidase